MLSERQHGLKVDAATITSFAAVFQNESLVNTMLLVDWQYKCALYYAGHTEINCISINFESIQSIKQY